MGTKNLPLAKTDALRISSRVSSNIDDHACVNGDKVLCQGQISTQHLAATTCAVISFGGLTRPSSAFAIGPAPFGWLRGWPAAGPLVGTIHRSGHACLGGTTGADFRAPRADDRWCSRRCRNSHRPEQARPRPWRSPSTVGDLSRWCSRFLYGVFRLGRYITRCLYTVISGFDRAASARFDRACRSGPLLRSGPAHEGFDPAPCRSLPQLLQGVKR